MTSNPLLSAAAVEQAVSQVTAIRPAYSSIIGFYGPVFVAQVQAFDNTSPEAIRIDEEAGKMKSSAGFSLIEPAAFTVDTEAAEQLLVEICRIATQSGEKLGLAGEALIRSMRDGVSMAELFVDILDDNGRVKDLAERMDAPRDMLCLLLYLAVKPSVEAGARQVAKRLASSRENRGSCPVCGSSPIIGELDAEGNRWVHCGMCWHRWPVARMACLFCDNRDSASREYLYSDDEPEYRVNLCAGCRRYLKVVDTRNLNRCFYPPLEQVASLHLDLMAAEKGYVHGVASPDSFTPDV